MLLLSAGLVCLRGIKATMPIKAKKIVSKMRVVLYCAKPFFLFLLFKYFIFTGLIVSNNIPYVTIFKMQQHIKNIYCDLLLNR